MSGGNVLAALLVIALGFLIGRAAPLVKDYAGYVARARGQRSVTREKAETGLLSTLGELLIVVLYEGYGIVIAPMSDGGEQSPEEIEEAEREESRVKRRGWAHQAMVTLVCAIALDPVMDLLPDNLIQRFWASQFSGVVLMAVGFCVVYMVVLVLPVVAVQWFLGRKEARSDQESG